MKNTIKALLLVLALGLSSTTKADTSAKVVALGIGAGTAYLFNLLPPAKPEVGPVFGPMYRRGLIVVLSLGLGVAYEAARKQADHTEFDLTNAYCSSLGTLAVVTFKF